MVFKSVKGSRNRVTDKKAFDSNYDLVFNNSNTNMSKNDVKSSAKNEIDLFKEIEKWSYKELGDYCIHNIWIKEKIGNKNSVVLDRVINILFSMDELMKTKI